MTPVKPCGKRGSRRRLHDLVLDARKRIERCRAGFGSTPAWSSTKRSVPTYWRRVIGFSVLSVIHAWTSAVVILSGGIGPNVGSAVAQIRADRPSIEDRYALLGVCARHAVAPLPGNGRVEGGIRGGAEEPAPDPAPTASGTETWGESRSRPLIVPRSF